MSKERELLRKALHVFTSSKVWGGQEYTYLPIHPCQYKGISAEIEELLSQPEQEPVVIDENTSDGYHTFKELYEFRKAYNVALFNEWGATGKCHTHKSWRHNDGELCFGGGWFIVVAVLPQGQISNHYEAKDWDLFTVPEVEKALFEFDGHTGADVVERLKLYTAPQKCGGYAQPELIGFVAESSVGFDVSRSVQSMPLLWLGKLEHGDKLYRVGKDDE